MQGITCRTIFIHDSLYAEQGSGVRYQDAGSHLTEKTKSRIKSGDVKVLKSSPTLGARKSVAGCPERLYGFEFGVNTVATVKLDPVVGLSRRRALGVTTPVSG